MPLVASGQFAYVFKLKRARDGAALAVRCFRGFLGDRDQRYQAITAHLRAHRVPALADCEYQPEGMIVGGRAFPILVMEWIEGPTLDVYIEEKLNRPDVLRHLADQWLDLIATLRASGAAHGDLQHGNIIVQNGRLRAVDLDGMFVPALAHLTAPELGHQHYQHPRRNARFFNAALDNFSSIVVYLSLISLAERPSLWAAHHDENLIFTRQDFASPGQSPLLAEIKDLGPDHRVLAGLLAEYAGADPDQAPSVIDLVAPRTLAEAPAPLDIAAANRTREASETEIPIWLGRASPVNAIVQHVKDLPFTVPNNQFVSLFTAPGATTTRWAYITLVAMGDAANFAVGSVFLLILMFPALSVLLLALGVPTYVAHTLAMLIYLLICSGVGLYSALNEAPGPAAPAQFPASTALQPPVFSIGQVSGPVPTLAPPVHVVYQPPNPMSGPLLVASAAQPVYHQLWCPAAGRIAAYNQLTFRSPAEARAAGYRQCRKCHP